MQILKMNLHNVEQSSSVPSSSDAKAARKKQFHVSSDHCWRWSSHSSMPAGPNSHFRSHGCIFFSLSQTHTHKHTCSVRSEWRWNLIGSKREATMMLRSPREHYHWKPLSLFSFFFQMLWFKKAPESDENGGGVGKAGMPVSESEERRGGGVEEE